VNGCGRPLEHAGIGVMDREVLPCMSCFACTILPPKASPMLWWPRQTPSIGILPAKAWMSRHRDAGLGFGCTARARRRCGRAQRGDLVDRDLVVADDAHLLAELAEILHEVVGEGIVVVDHQQHVRPLSPCDR
jgi:hypothetical protein